MNWAFWAFLSAFFAGLTALLVKLGVEEIDSNLANAVRTTVILILAWTIALFSSSTALAAIQAKTWLYLVLSGLATGASWLCYFRALQLGKVSQVAPVDKLSVVFAIGLALVFLHEKLTWQQWLGATLIVSGTVVLVYVPR